jgi:hypothetical protein
MVIDSTLLFHPRNELWRLWGGAFLSEKKKKMNKSLSHILSGWLLFFFIFFQFCELSGLEISVLFFFVSGEISPFFYNGIGEKR